MKKMNWKKYGFEFLSIFIAVIAAFTLNNWNENRRNDRIENKILTEILNGLEKDIDDVLINKGGHEDGIAACKYWRSIVQGKVINTDTTGGYYFNLTRDYISIQNVSGYESLKSKGLDLIKNDSLRFKIIDLYEYDYNLLKKFEEEYHEMQYQKNYFAEINKKIAPNFTFNDKGDITGMQLPLQISNDERAMLLSYLWKIQVNRNFILSIYVDIEEKIAKLQAKIEKYLAR